MREVKGAREKSSPSHSTIQPLKKSRVSQPSKVCSLKTCHNQTINPQTDCYVEIKATLPENGDSFLKNSVVLWEVSGDARFHTECWNNLIKSSRARSPKSIIIKLTQIEKTILKEAAKTVEHHDSAEILKKEAARIATLLQRSKHCVVFSGAGISTSAGIGDYRGKGGKWTEEDREAVYGGQPETEDAGVPYDQLRPTYTHEALVKLVELGIIKHIISQNGDGLHGLSGVPVEKLSELHGNVFVEVCENCSHRYSRPFYVLDDTASQYYEDIEDYGSTVTVKPRHAVKCPTCGLCHRTGRRCEQGGCKGYLKDSIINFGDNLEEAVLSQAEQHADQADLFLSLGTTMQVTPACDLVLRGKKPMRLVIVNRQKTVFDELCLKKAGREILGSRVFGDCDDLLAEVMAHIMTGKERKEWEGGRRGRMEGYDQLRGSSI